MTDTMTVLHNMQGDLFKKRDDAVRKVDHYRRRAQQATATEQTGQAASLNELADYWLGIYAGLGKALKVLQGEIDHQAYLRYCDQVTTGASEAL